MGPTLIGVIPTMLAVVPPLSVWLVRHVTAVHVGGATVQLALFLGPPGAQTQLVEAAIPATTNGNFDTRLVFEAGEEVWASSSNAAAAMVVTLQGFDLHA